MRVAVTGFIFYKHICHKPFCNAALSCQKMQMPAGFLQRFLLQIFIGCRCLALAAKSLFMAAFFNKLGKNT